MARLSGIMVKRMDKRFLLILAAIIVIVGGIFWFSKAKQNSPTTGTNSKSSSQGSNHVTGNPNSKVVLVEYGDFQCPSCGQYFPIIEQVRQKFGDKIKFQFINFPLVQIHQNAMAAARAAEAASNQGKFWEMYELLYQNQQSWASVQNVNPIFEQYAAQIGLDVNKFKTDMASEAVASTINADIARAQAIGASGTPTFVLNGKKVDNPPRTLDGFIQLVQQAIDQQASQQ